MTLPVIYNAESPLEHPRRFCRQALRDLRGSGSTAMRLLKQSLAQRYRHSSLGLFWAVAPSAVTTILLTAGRHANLAPLASGSVAPQVYAVFGLTLAQTFLETFSTQRVVFNTYKYLLSRHRSPIEGLILAGMADNLVSLAIRLAILAGVFLLCGTRPAATFPLGLAGIGSIFCIGSALGLLLAPLSSLKRDLDSVMTFLPWAVFGLTPVFAEPTPGGTVSRIVRLNPLTWVFDATRAFSYGAAGNITMLAASLVAGFVLLILAWLLCRLARPIVVERFLM